MHVNVTLLRKSAILIDSRLYSRGEIENCTKTIVLQGLDPLTKRPNGFKEGALTHSAIRPLGVTVKNVYLLLIRKASVRLHEVWF